MDLMWPPKGIDLINVVHYPLLNTVILLISGLSVT
jgi:heme/copper-type cytochrome/quinol oxidase subunit 3